MSDAKALAVRRVTLMRMAQPALMPSTLCADAPPEGMQRHRESVVHLIKGVRYPHLTDRRPGPPAPSSDHTHMARHSLHLTDAACLSTRRRYARNSV